MEKKKKIWSAEGGGREEQRGEEAADVAGETRAEAKENESRECRKGPKVAEGEPRPG